LTSEDIKASSSAQYVVLSYALSIKKEVLSHLEKQKFDVLISDECHFLKSYKAKRTLAFFKHILPLSKYKLYLSGTPFTKNIVDCYTVFHSILPQAFSTFFDFATRYSHMRVTHFGRDFVGLKNADELKSIIRKHFYLRYRKVDVLKELPPLQYQRVSLPSNYSVKEYGDAAGKALWEAIQKTKQSILDGKRPFMPENLANHRRMQGEAKIPAVIEFAKELLEQEIPVVIFAHHKAVVHGIVEGLKEYSPYMITGDTSATDRAKYIEDFQAGNSNVIVCNIIAGGIGCTLSRSNTVIMAEMSYSPSDNTQAISRCHRISTQGQVIVYWMIVDQSIDEDVEQIVIRKTQEFEEVFDRGTS
jgi:SNF2 family DNA or RNA helicase